MYKTLLEQVHAGDYQPAIKIDKGRIKFKGIGRDLE